MKIENEFINNKIELTIENNEIEIVENVDELNNKKIDDLKINIDLYYLSSNSNNDIVNEIFENEFIEINDEILIDINDDLEFIENVIIISIVNKFKSIINYDEIIDKLNYYIYDRFINVNDEFVKNVLTNKKHDDKYNYDYYEFKDRIIINRYVNYNIISLIKCILENNDLFVDPLNEYEYIIENKFLIENYDIIDDILLIYYDENIIDNYNNIIECIYVYEYDDIIDDINEIFEINDRLKDYINYDDIIDDLIIDEYYYEFDNYYIHNSYF